jgi:hypothetical protein
MDHPWLGPPWTIHGRAARAHRSLASGRFGAQGRQPRGGGWGDGVGNPLRASPEDGRRRGGRVTEGMGSGGRCAGERIARAKRGEGGSEEGRCCPGVLPVAFIGQGRELMCRATAASGGGIDGRLFQP